MDAPRPTRKPSPLFYIGGAILLFINSGSTFGIFFALRHHAMYRSHPLAGIIGIGGWVIRLLARLSMRTSLEQHFNGPEPFGLRLSAAMTFCFGGLYHQYHLNRITDLKNAARYFYPSL